MKNIIFTFISIGILVSFNSYAQVTIGANTAPNADAVLDLISNTNKGLLLPRVALTSTTTFTPMSAFVAGMTVFNTATAGDVTPGFYYCDGIKWVRLADASSAWLLKGNAGTVPGTNFLGTTDNKDLIFKTNSTFSGRINGDSGVTQFGYNSAPMLMPTGDGSQFNTIIGYEAGLNLRGGEGNTLLGCQAGYSLFTPSWNTLIGYKAGNKISYGGENTIIGQSAGGNITIGRTNIAIGCFQDVASATGSNQLNIGGAIFGTGMTGTVMAPAGNIGINTTTPGNTLEVKSTTAGTSGVRFTNLVNAPLLGTNANGDVITATATTTNGAFWGLTGNSGTIPGTNFLGTTDDKDIIFKRNNTRAGWINTSLYNTSFGAFSLQTITTGSGNTAFGYTALSSNTSTNNNTAFGTNAIRLNTGSENTAIGFQTMNVSGTGSYNTAVGSQSLNALSTGTNNTAIGYLSLNANNTGTNNTALGDNALLKNTAACCNTAVGSRALSNLTGGNTITAARNTAVGNEALFSNTTGNYNVAIGDNASYKTTGTNNVSLGYRALYNNTSGNNNTSLGNVSGQNLTTGSNNIAIGNTTDLPSATASNQMNIGNTIFGTGMTGTVLAPAGKIGIGTTTPSTTLHVKNATSPAIRIEDGTQVAGRVLTSDANGNGAWQAPAITTIAGIFPASSITFTTYGTGTPAVAMQYTGGTITLPPGKWLISVGSTANIDGDSDAVINVDGSLWCTAFFSDASSSGTVTPDLISSYTGQRGTAGVISRGENKCFVSGYCAVNNTSGANKTYYLWAVQEKNGPASITKSTGGNAYLSVFSNVFWEKYFFAMPIQ